MRESGASSCLRVAMRVVMCAVLPVHVVAAVRAPQVLCAHRLLHPQVRARTQRLASSAPRAPRAARAARAAREVP
eukprot:4937405-Prymnesium_polylepis.1